MFEPEFAQPEHCPTGSMSLQDQVANKVLLTKGALEAAIDHIRGAVMIAFPQGLPEWDLVRQALEGTEELAGTSVSVPPLCQAHACSTLQNFLIMLCPAVCSQRTICDLVFC